MSRMKESNVFATAAVLNLISETVKDADQRQWIEGFERQEVWDISDHSLRISTGKALSIVKRMLKNGANAKDLWKGLQYLWICINAKKYNLDMESAALGFDISELSEKYRNHEEESQEEEPDDIA